MKNLGILLTIAAVGFGGYLLYKSYQEKKVDETPVSYEEALKKLDEAKSE
jgi:predicted negative regulator of RcsB-dependent stress response